MLLPWLLAGAIYGLARFAKAVGRAQTAAEAAEKGLDHARTAAEIRDNLDQLSDAERVEWLRQRDRGG